MLRVMLVDDEPFIVKGLSVLIDWEAEGFEIVHMALSGQEALDYVRKQPVDLIIADIQMPAMSGLELMERLRKERISDAYFIILSGYSNFEYARQAMRYECLEYLLKPVQEESLALALKKVLEKKEITVRREQDSRQMRQAYLLHNLAALLHGRYEQRQLDYVREHMKWQGEARYIQVELDDVASVEEMSDDELETERERLFENCRAFLGEDADHCIRNPAGYGKEPELGLLYCDYMASQRGLDIREFLQRLLDASGKGLSLPVVLLAGKPAELSRISRSYGNACVLRSFRGFRNKKQLYFYEEELAVKQTGLVLCKDSLDLLIQAVEQNDKPAINRSVEQLFNEMESLGMQPEVLTMNTNYLMFQLIHLAVEQDESVNQEEVMSIIAEGSFESGISRGSKAHLRKFAGEYAEYLIQLRRNVSPGILKEVEREVREHYAENLTLCSLGRKYFINSSYLGQIFRKQYGQSFKDYLSNYRINEAASLLLHTEIKISRIAEEVGYHDMDYFVSRFIAVKGCTPAKYRKQART